MTPPPEILYVPDWSAIFAGIAVLISLYTLWYSKFRKGKLLFACSRWSNIGLSNNNKTGAAFAVNIDIHNTGPKAYTLYDLLIQVETSQNKKIYYDPIFLFDMTTYVQSVGKQNQIGLSNNGGVPLPIIIPDHSVFKFPFEILFMPQDKATTVILPEDAPFTIKLFAKTSRQKNYSEVAYQEIAKDDIKDLKNGNFSGVLSTSSIKDRSNFINK